MKRTITVLLLAIVSIAKSQNTVTPTQNVQNAFATQFLNASTVQWNAIPHSSNFEAKFVDGGVPKTAHFSPEGNLLFAESKLEPAQLPAEVTQSLHTNFLGFDLGQIRKIEISKEVTFKVIVRKGNDQYEVEFELTGKIRTKKIIEQPQAPTQEPCDDRDDKGSKRKEKKHKKHKHDHDGRHGNRDDQGGDDDHD